MKAFVITKYKQPLALAEISEPTVGDHDVLVRIEAAGLNLVDEKIRTGEFRQLLPYRLPQPVGSDLAGTVISVGTKVTSFEPGQKVFGIPRQTRIGTFAERIAVADADIALAPATITVEEAASLPLVALTSWQALVERGKVSRGQKVLIHGGAGGVGSIAIQLAKHLGATVAATASGSNLDFVRGLGADVVIDYRNQDFERELSGYDLVVDSLGGQNLEKSLRVLGSGGKAIGLYGVPDPSFAKEQGMNPLLRAAVGVLSRKIRSQARRLGVVYEFMLMHASGAQLAEIAALVDAGAIRPVVGKVVPFERIPEALRALELGGIRGKAVATGSS